jgi:hypothetical protein
LRGAAQRAATRQSSGIATARFAHLAMTLTVKPLLTRSRDPLHPAHLHPIALQRPPTHIPPRQIHPIHARRVLLIRWLVIVLQQMPDHR